jgi:sec-independent protein translocase protein TatA
MGFDNPLHLAFLVVLLLLVFGAKRLPEIGRSLGAGMRSFRESIGGEIGSSPSLTELSAPTELGAPPAESSAPPAESSAPAESTGRPIGGAPSRV